MSKKKLLITASTFPRWEGDTEPRFILDYAKEMNRYYDVTVLVPSAPDTLESEMLEGVRVIRYRYFPIKKWETLCYPGSIVGRIKKKKIRILLVPWLLISLLYHLHKYSKKVDAVHAHWFIPQGILQSFLKCPYIITGHGTDVTSMNQGIFRYLKKRAAQNANHIVVVSEKLRNIILNVTEIKKEKVSVISMGCNTREFGEKYDAPNFFEQDGKKVVLFVGRLDEIKGVSYLIEAVKKIDVRLVIVGDGPLRDELKHQAAGYGEQITFLGSKSHEELKRIYASADIFVAPSITASNGSQEGFGLVIIEAMASGLPVIASRTGGIVDIIQDGRNGLLCEEKNVEQLRSTIERLLKDEQLYNELKQSGMETAAKYDYSEIAKRYKKIIDSVCMK